MIAAAALGYIVKKRRDVQHPRALEITHQLAAERVFMRVFGHRETAEIAQHHQDVLIDGIDVIQVMLHLPDNAPEVEQITPEHARLVHQPQRVRDAFGLLQDRHEQAPVLRIAPPVAAHQVARVVDCSQRSRRQTLYAACLFVQQERFENGVRFALENVVAGDFQHALLLDETLVEHARNAARRWKQLRFHVLDQDGGKLRNGFRGPVITAHELFARALGRSRFVAEAFRQRRLQVEHKNVLPPLGNHMQPRAQGLQKTFVATQFAGFPFGDEATGIQFTPAAAETGRARDPQNELQIAQPAGAFLDIRLQAVRRVLIFGVPLAHFQDFRLEERTRIERLPIPLLERLEQFLTFSLPTIRRASSSEV